MRSDVAPTRENYLEIQDRLERVRRGEELLERKRQILITELMSKVEAAKRIKDEINETMAAAFEAVRRAAILSGVTGLARQASGVEMEHSLSVTTRSVMGVPVPEIDCKAADFGLYFGVTEGRSSTDEVMRRFLEAVELVAELAEVENTVFRLAREIRRTQRRVNALDKMFIPRLEDNLDRIEGVLEERAQEEFVLLREVKRKRREKRR